MASRMVNRFTAAVTAGFLLISLYYPVGVFASLSEVVRVDQPVSSEGSTVTDAVYQYQTVLLAESSFVVNDTSDTQDAVPGDGICADANGNCTLRAAIMEANESEDASVIILPSGTYLLSIEGTDEEFAATGDLDVLKPLTIRGSGADQTIIDGSGIDRVFDVRADSFELSGVTITGGSIQSQGLGNGGGLLLSGNCEQQQCQGEVAGEYRITDSRINGNEAASGGGIYLQYGQLTLDNVTISDNTAMYGYGAGVYAHEGTQVEMQRTIIEDNESTIDGGGLYNLGSASLSEVTFIHNTAYVFGGAVYSTGEVVVTQGIFEHNDSGEQGGAVYNAGHMSVTDGTFEHNQAGSEGGAIFHHSHGYGYEEEEDTFLAIRRTVIANNTAGNGDWGAGGGIASYGAIQLSDSAVSFNSAHDIGGGLYTASYEDGDLPGESDGVPTFRTVIESTTFHSNTAGLNGGGMYAEATVSVVNSTFAYNEAGMAGGGILAEGLLVLNHSTVSGNMLTQSGQGGQSQGSGLYVLDGSGQNPCQGCDEMPGGSAVIVNSIIYGNSDDSDCYGTISPIGLNIIGGSGCTVEDEYFGFVIDEDPRLGELADNGGFAKTFALLPGSPAIDAAELDVPDYVTVPTEDQRGVAREQGERSDIGAYEVEWTPYSVTAYFDADTEQIHILFESDLVTNTPLQPEKFQAYTYMGNERLYWDIGHVAYGEDGRTVILQLEYFDYYEADMHLILDTNAVMFADQYSFHTTTNVWMPQDTSTWLDEYVGESEQVDIRVIMKVLAEGNLQERFGDFAQDSRIIRYLLSFIETKYVTLG